MTLRGSVSSALAPAGLTALAALAALAASCGGKAKPPPPPPAPVVAKKPPPPPPPPVCIPAGEPAMVARATADAGLVQFCVGDGADRNDCFAVELDTKTYQTVDAAPISQPPGLAIPAARVVAAPTEVSICVGEGDTDCKTLKPKVAKNAERPIEVAIDLNGTNAVLMLGDAEAGRGVAEVWSVTKGKKTATIKYAKGDNKCGTAQLLGDVIYISSSVCAGPAARGALYSLKGKKLGDVGGKDFGTYGTVGVQVTETQWAFLEEGGGVIALQDVRTGKVDKTIELLALWERPAGGADGGAPRGGGNPGESALVRGADGTLIVIAGAPSAGTVGVVDIAAGEVVVIPALPCKADVAPAPAPEPEPEPAPAAAPAAPAAEAAEAAGAEKP